MDDQTKNMEDWKAKLAEVKAEMKASFKGLFVTEQQILGHLDEFVIQVYGWNSE